MSLKQTVQKEQQYNPYSSMRNNIKDNDNISSYQASEERKMSEETLSRASTIVKKGVKNKLNVDPSMSQLSAANSMSDYSMSAKYKSKALFRRQTLKSDTLKSSMQQEAKQPIQRQKTKQVEFKDSQVDVDYFEPEDKLTSITSLYQLVQIVPAIEFESRHSTILKIKGKRYRFEIGAKKPPEEPKNTERRRSMITKSPTPFKRQTTIAAPSVQIEQKVTCNGKEKFDRNCHCIEMRDKLQVVINQKDQEINSYINKLKQIKESQDRLKEILSQDDIVSMEKELIRDEFVKFLSATQIQDDRQHVTVLHASPLGYKATDKKGGNAFKTAAQLDFIQDINGIEEALKVTERQINYKVKLGTPMNLVHTLDRDPLVLHIISHGIQLDKNRTGLLLENEDGSGTIIEPTRLRILMQVSAAHLENVFLSSCHSEPLSEVMLELGAKHVICIDKDKTVKDKACIIFSKVYYLNLFSLQKTPCEAFELAKNALIAVPELESQAKLFKLKTNKDHYCNPYSLIRGKPKNLDMINVDSRLLPNSMPSKVDSFIGRQEEMKEFMNALLTCRILTIKGASGIGKSSIAKMIANFLYDRQHQFCKQGQSPGILFINLSNVSTIHQILLKFIKKFMQSMRKQISKYDKKESHVIFDRILDLIDDKKFLFILDDCEDCLKNDRALFKNLIEEILTRCKNARILFTCKFEMSSTLGGFKHYKEEVREVKPLSMKESEDLLTAKANKKLSMDEKQKLHEMKPERGLRTQLRNAYTHLFEEILGGNPSAISLASATFKECSIIELYQKLNSEDMSEGMQYKEAQKQMKASLCLSLKLISESKARLMFGLIGFFSGGIRPKDVYKILELMNARKNDEAQEVFTSKRNIEVYQFIQQTQQQLQTNIETLMKASLVSKKKFTWNKTQVDVYKLLRLMKKFAISNSLDLAQRKYFAGFILEFFIKKLTKLYKKNNLQDLENNEMTINKLFFYEANIWDCIYRGLKEIGIKRIQSQKEQETQKLLQSQKNLPRIMSESEFFPDDIDSDIDKREQDEKTKFFEGLKQRPIKQKLKFMRSLTHQATSPPRQESKEAILPTTFKEEIKEQPEEQNQKELDEKNHNVFKKLANGVRQIMKNDMKIDVEDATLINFLKESKTIQSYQEELLTKDNPGVLYKINALKNNRARSPDNQRKANIEMIKSNIHSGLREEMEDRNLRTKRRMTALNSTTGQIQMLKQLEQIAKEEQEESKVPKKEANEEELAEMIIKDMRQDSKSLCQNMNNFKRRHDDPPPYMQIKTKKYKQMFPLQQLLTLYVTNLILMNKKLYSLKIIDQYGKRFFDKDLLEGNLRKLTAVALISKKKDDKYQNCIEGIKEFLKASVIFGQLECSHGLAICNAAIGHILSQLMIQFILPDDKRTTLYKAKKKYQEAIQNYKLIGHLKGQSYCYQRLYEIKKELCERSRREYDQHVRIENLYQEAKAAGKSDFIERKQGIEMSLFTEPVESCVDIIKTNKADQGNILNQIVNGILLKNEHLKQFKEMKKNVYETFLDGVVNLVQKKQRFDKDATESVFSHESHVSASPFKPGEFKPSKFKQYGRQKSMASSGSRGQLSAASSTNRTPNKQRVTNNHFQITKVPQIAHPTHKPNPISVNKNAFFRTIAKQAEFTVESIINPNQSQTNHSPMKSGKMTPRNGGAITPRKGGAITPRNEIKTSVYGIVGSSQHAMGSKQSIFTPVLKQKKSFVDDSKGDAYRGLSNSSSKAHPLFSETTDVTYQK